MANLIPARPTYRKERLFAGFLALSAFTLLFAYRLLDRYKYINAQTLSMGLLAAVVVFLLPALVFCALRGQGYLPYLRLRAPQRFCIPLLIFGFLSLFFGALLLSILCNSIGLLDQKEVLTPTDTDVLNNIGRFFVFAFFPALFEEFFFRGILVAEYERRGAFRAVLLSSLLFALVHFDIRNLAVYLFCGVFLALLLLATDSLPAVMLIHLLYNTVAFFGQTYLTALFEFTGSVELFLFFLILFFLVSLILFCNRAFHVYRIRERAGELRPRRAVPYNVQFYTTLDAIKDPPVVLCFLLAIAGMILFF